MRINFKEIVEGWRNLIIPPEHMKEMIDQVAEERMTICKGCPHMSTNAKLVGYNTIRQDEHCTKCGCPLAAKVRSLSSECPLKYWEAVTTSVEQYEIEKQIKDETSKKLQEENPGSSEGTGGGVS